MPIIKSAKKRVKITEKRTLINRMQKSRLKTAIKRFEKAASSDDVNNISEELSKTQKTIDKIAAKGIIHKNTAARKKSQLAKLANGVSRSASQ